MNNCHYVRFVRPRTRPCLLPFLYSLTSAPAQQIESARMRFAEVVARDLPPQRQADIVRGSGESMILGSISVRYRRPVV